MAGSGAKGCQFWACSMCDFGTTEERLAAAHLKTKLGHSLRVSAIPGGVPLSPALALAALAASRSAAGAPESAVPRICGIVWPVCDKCLGEGLHRTAGYAWCPKCQTRWADADVMPCPWPATSRLVDHDGQHGLVCRSHAAHPSVATWGKAEELAAHVPKGRA